MRFAAGGVLALLFGPSYVLAGDVCDNFKPCLPTKWITDIGTFDCVRNGDAYQCKTVPGTSPFPPGGSVPKDSQPPSGGNSGKHRSPGTDGSSGTGRGPQELCNGQDFQATCSPACTDPIITLDGIEYERRCNQNTKNSAWERKQYSTPQDCAKHECTNDATCLGIGWNDRRAPTCYVYRKRGRRTMYQVPRTNEHILIKRGVKL